MTRHLLHVGMPKAGSKYLQEWFRRNPAVAFTDWGFAGFRRTYELARTAISRDPPGWHVTSFEGFALPLKRFDHFDRPGRLPTRAEQALMCETLASLFRASRVLIVTRGYRDLVWSLYAEAVRGGGTFSLDEFAGRIAHLAARGRNPIDYDHVIGLYAAAFGAERLILLPFERLERDPAGFIAALEAELGTPPCPPLGRRVRPSFAPSALPVYLRLNRLARPGRGGRFRRLYVDAVRRDALAWPAGLIGTAFRGREIARDDVPDLLLDRLRGTATSLAGHPLYRELGDHYLF